MDTLVRRFGTEYDSFLSQGGSHSAATSAEEGAAPQEAPPPKHAESAPAGLSRFVEEMMAATDDPTDGKAPPIVSWDEPPPVELKTSQGDPVGLRMLLNAVAHTVEKEIAWLAITAPDKLPATWLRKRRRAEAAKEAQDRENEEENEEENEGSGGSSQGAQRTVPQKSQEGVPMPGDILKVRATVMDYEHHPAWVNLPLFENDDPSLVSPASSELR